MRGVCALKLARRYWKGALDEDDAKRFRRDVSFYLTSRFLDEGRVMMAHFFFVVIKSLKNGEEEEDDDDENNGDDNTAVGYYYNSITHDSSIKKRIQHSSRAKKVNTHQDNTNISLNPLEKQHAQIHRAAILRLWHVRLGRQKRDFAVARDGRHRALIVRLPIRHQSHLTSDHFYFPAFQVVYFVWF